MELALTIFLFALGVLFIIKGGDWFVDSAVWMAEVTGIPKFIIGATIVSLATTLPEMLVSVMAALEGKVDMAVGNAVGSVTANTGLILAVTVLAIPAMVNRRHFARVPAGDLHCHGTGALHREVLPLAGRRAAVRLRRLSRDYGHLTLQVLPLSGMIPILLKGRTLT